jgi:hypothetical protein
MFTALSMGMAFGGHLLQLPARMSYDAPLWRSTQSMYRLFGPPIGAIVEGGAWLTSVVLAVFVRKRRPAFRWTVGGAACFVLAQVLWWLFVFPVNNHMKNWTPDTMPADWMRWRAQWEFTHAVRAILQITGLGALLYSVLVETPQDRPTAGPLSTAAIRSLVKEWTP